MKPILFAILFLLSVNAMAQPQQQHRSSERSTKALITTPQDSVNYRNPARPLDTTRSIIHRTDTVRRKKTK